MLLNDLQAHWTPIAPLFLLRNEEEYDAAVVRLNALVDEIGTDEQHPLYGLLDTLGTLIHTYEQRHHEIPSASGRQVLEFLMEEHGLDPSDLAELGDAETAQCYLSGQQELSVDQVRALSKRFRVSPALFI